MTSLPRRAQDRARKSIADALTLLRRGERQREALGLLERAEADLATVENVAGGCWVLIHHEESYKLRERDRTRVRGLFTTREQAETALPVERWLDVDRVVEDEHTRQCCRFEPWLIRDVVPYLGPAPAVQIHEHVWAEATAADGSMRRVCRFPRCNILEPDRS